MNESYIAVAARIALSCATAEEFEERYRRELQDLDAYDWQGRTKQMVDMFRFVRAVSGARIK